MSSQKFIVHFKLQCLFALIWLKELSVTVISIDKLTETLRMKQIHGKNIELLEQVKGGVLCLTGRQMDDAAAVTEFNVLRQ